MHCVSSRQIPDSRQCNKRRLLIATYYYITVSSSSAAAATWLSYM
jgi:hypothetical protein